jgi:deoxyribose-phosphate aldolase
MYSITHHSGNQLQPPMTNITGSESYNAIAKGARELDMVINIGALKSSNYVEVYEDILSISRVCSSSCPRVILKAIVETALLTNSEIVAACYIAAEAGVNFVKTCTGFSGGKATVEHVRLMSKTVGYKGGKVQVKASGGVRDLDSALALCKAGASRIGTSSGVEILLETSGVTDGTASSQSQGQN